jgi:hypothetical protein
MAVAGRADADGGAAASRKQAHKDKRKLGMRDSTFILSGLA